mmetsp:Transcript_89139/g.285754  ORF Transcript_89139/g.285754 Transcript_89139/m.285754 type:complete len:182 (+) Transcript_89139:3-548(+)
MTQVRGIADGVLEASRAAGLLSMLLVTSLPVFVEVCTRQEGCNLAVQQQQPGRQGHASCWSKVGYRTAGIKREGIQACAMGFSTLEGTDKGGAESGSLFAAGSDVMATVSSSSSSESGRLGPSRRFGAGRHTRPGIDPRRIRRRPGAQSRPSNLGAHAFASGRVARLELEGRLLGLIPAWA